ncbi:MULTISPECIES: PA2779 family protein [unclassified Thioalkalivibrio]|uniref:PA2779 family protein n=1 Tax=unclassified Thioalkalivibrio TaxID=2621013 RepID=UPI00037EA3B4|nr:MULTISPECIES: PA2779 family protein [unclassified Thioalkalivibrio]
MSIPTISRLRRTPSVSGMLAGCCALGLALLPATSVLAETAERAQGASASGDDTGQMVGTRALIDQVQAEDTRAQLLERLDDASVQEQLIAMGVDPEQARERVARLTDEELAELEARIDSEPVGAAGALGVVAIVFLVFVITDALGVTDIFAFVHPPGER